MFSCEYCKNFRITYFEKQLQTAASKLEHPKHPVSKLQKWEMENFQKRWNIYKGPFRDAQKDTNPKYFFKFQENVSHKASI